METVIGYLIYIFSRYDYSIASHNFDMETALQLLTIYSFKVANRVSFEQ
ncbi:hypothetical protein VCRA2119O147_1140006 [Vibrio crassostreae]|nr:hypothetical protein VCRA2119O145_10133 [Vibrio crassostreae]CAK1837288.1 hypothetical protein VCRA2118O144_10102 [Vibrio crassostreae]CAK2260388.1 hypothetical protein VCRA2119O147_1140006 [Vibrio crassostreae]CAK2292254.1 hypothetical protein VCRA2117O143_160002 [Vibrio crassostreae]CAK2377675.1 hypothetical protein VCRA2117O142_590011 [Vibrio crassostreae]